VTGPPEEEPDLRRRGSPPGRRAAGAAVLAVALLAGAAVAAVAGVASNDRGRLADAMPPQTRPQVAFGGRGFGHGVGLQQWGARGAALAGLDTDAILAHYYPGAQIGPSTAREVRVLVSAGGGEVTVGTRGPGVVRDGATGRVLARLTSGTAYTLSRSGAGLTLAGPSGAAVAADLPAFLSVEPTGKGTVRLGDAGYRGRLRIQGAGEGIEVVNVVPLEDYLLGVVPREMPPSWGDDAPAALRAQAVAARSYTLAIRRTGGTFDLYSDTRSQAYGGVRAEDPRTTAAVRATAGQVLTHDGDVITAYYSASSGGRTEDARNVFPSSQDRPYLRSVPDPYDAVSPYHRWTPTPTFDAERLGRLVGAPGPVAQIEVTRRGASPRVLDANVVTAWPRYARTPTTGTRLRAQLDLPDTWFTAVPRALSADGTALPAGAGDPRSRVWLAVLNGAGTQGLAGRTADRAESLGYEAVSTGDAPARAEPSVVYWRPGSEAAAARAAGDLGIADVAPMPGDPALARTAPAGAQVVVLLGTG
jgi:SpoIID/LytB domain protein